MKVDTAIFLVPDLRRGKRQSEAAFICILLGVELKVAQVSKENQFKMLQMLILGLVHKRIKGVSFIKKKKERERKISSAMRKNILQLEYRTL